MCPPAKNYETTLRLRTRKLGFCLSKKNPKNPYLSIKHPWIVAFFINGIVYSKFQSIDRGLMIFHPPLQMMVQFQPMKVSLICMKTNPEVVLTFSNWFEWQLSWHATFFKYFFIFFLNSKARNNSINTFFNERVS